MKIFFWFLLLSVVPVHGWAQSVSEAAEAPPVHTLTWEALEAKGAVIEGIEFIRHDVFDPDRKGERHWFGRAANAIHITTHQKVVTRELLFKVGEKVDARRIHETERNLRNLDCIGEAAVMPFLAENGWLVARVITRDSWSLKFGTKFASAGGDNSGSIKIKEVNLLGLGKSVKFEYAKNAERSTRNIGYLDPQFLGSDWTLDANLDDLSDGRARSFRVERPFRSLETQWRAMAYWKDQQSVETRYLDGQRVGTIPFAKKESGVGGDWAFIQSKRKAYRVGLAFQSFQESYGPMEGVTGFEMPAVPADLKDLGPFIRLSMVEDRFEEFHNLKNVGFVEDYNLGWQWTAGAGFCPKSLGSLHDALRLELQLSKTWRLSEQTLLMLESRSEARHQNTWTDFHKTTLACYNASLPWQTLAGYAAVSGGVRPDHREWLYLGGFDGLRGYPNHFKAGDRTWQISLEDRIITPWKFWGMIQMGFVVYLDAASIRQFGPKGWSPVYGDAGAGLRVGDLKSAFGKVWIFTIAFPLRRELGVDRYQFVFGNIIRF